MIMNELKEFLEGNLAKQLALETARLQKNDDQYKALYDECLSHYLLVKENGTPWKPIYGDVRSKHTRKLNRLQSIPIHKGSTFDHPEFGQVGAFATGAMDPNSSSGGYYRRYTVANTPEGPRIVSVDAFCPGCLCSGQQSGAACAECNGTGWKYYTGYEHPELGAPTAVERYTPPTDERYLTAHERDD